MCFSVLFIYSVYILFTKPSPFNPQNDESEHKLLLKWSTVQMDFPKFYVNKAENGERLYIVK